MAERVLENGLLKAVIRDQGAELVSLQDRTSGQEYIWDASPDVWNRHAPVLFPFVGKVYGGVYRHQGKEYELRSQHGFARDSRFDCVKEEKDCVIHRLCDTEETRAVYPFAFRLEVIHRLEGRTLTVEYRVENPGEDLLYYSVGGHPGFAVAEGTKRSEYRLRFPGKERLRYILIDPESGCAKPDRKYTLELENGCCPVPEDMFDRDALIFDGNQIQKVEILRSDGTPQVSMEAEGFPSFGIWSKPEGPYICLEPWAGRTDNVGFAGELPEKYGIQKLEPGGCERKSYRITVA